MLARKGVVLRLGLFWCVLAGTFTLAGQKQLTIQRLEVEETSTGAEVHGLFRRFSVPPPPIDCMSQKGHCIGGGTPEGCTGPAMPKTEPDCPSNHNCNFNICEPTLQPTCCVNCNQPGTQCPNCTKPGYCQ